MIEDNRQVKLTSVDYLMALLRKLSVCSERVALRVFVHHRQEIFYRHGNSSQYGDPRCVKVPLK